MQVVHNISLSGYKATFDGCFGRLPLGTAGSYGNEFLQLDAGTDWDGFVITANFVNANGEVTAVVYTPGELLPVPPEATQYSGAGDIVIEGTSDGKRIYTVDIPTQITAHADLSGEAPAPTPDRWAQYVAQVQQYADSAKQSAAAAAESETNASASEQAAQSSETAAAVSEDNAAQSAEDAAKSAELAQQAADNAGWFYVYGEDGILYMVRSDNAPDDFALRDNGEGVLEAVYG